MLNNEDKIEADEPSIQRTPSFRGKSKATSPLIEELSTKKYSESISVAQSNDKELNGPPCVTVLITDAEVHPAPVTEIDRHEEEVKEHGSSHIPQETEHTPSRDDELADK